MARVEFPPAEFSRFLNCGPTVLAVAQHGGQPNIITLAWVTPVSHRPPLVAVAVAPRRYSHGLIAASGELTLNVPPWELLEETYYCGSASGRDVDKFAATALTAEPSKYVGAPGISECLATLECRVTARYETGDHTLFVCEVVRVVADEGGAARRFGLGAGGPTTIHHLGGRVFAPLGGPAVEAGRRRG